MNGSSNTGLRYGTVPSGKYAEKFIVDSNGYFKTTISGGANRYLGLKPGSSTTADKKWQTESSLSSSISGETFYLFVKSSVVVKKYIIDETSTTNIVGPQGI